MSKKSNKTSHVLSLLTNRTGVVPGGTDTQNKEDSAAGDSPDAELKTTARTPIPVGIADPVRVVLTNPTIANLTRQEGLDASNESSQPIEPPKPKPEMVSDLIRTELERSFEEELNVSDYIPEKFTDDVPAYDLSPIDVKGETPMNEMNQNEDDASELKNSYVNVMEEIVKYNALPLMESLGVCTCQHCVNDVIALSLNQMPPRYVVTEKGTLFTKASAYESQHSVDILSAIAKACMQVKNSPRHVKK